MPKKKRGVDQRVKGNAKAASSGRMAELLNMGAEGVGFVGFEAVSREGGGGGSRITDDMSLLGVSSSGFQVVMKQLGKRDTTTKLKALTEFSHLCEIESVETVMTIMNIWPLMYNKLSTDNDHRVREASHKSLQACAEKIGKGLGPHLRTLIGCWVAGMCDPHGPSSCAAQAAFESAFPTEKQPEVFKFGAKAIVSHARDVALVENADTYSDPKVVPEDERVQRYERAVTMAILGLCQMFRKLHSATAVEKESDVWESFMTEARVWKLAKHQNPSVRSSIFSLVVALCCHEPTFVTAHPKLLCPLVLSSLGESEPLVVGPLWEAVLLILSVIESWHTHVNTQKALLPGLWSLLAAGGHGCALTIYPCLLPLASKLKEVASQEDTFDMNFMQRMMAGLDSDRPRSSPSECEMIMATFSECMLYFISHDAGSPCAHSSDLLTLIIQLVDRSIQSASASQSLAVAMGVVNVLSRIESLCQKIVPLHSSLDMLWKSLEQQLMIHLKSDNDKVIGRVGTFLKCFCVKTEASSQSAERKSVRFSSHSSAEQMQSSTVTSSVSCTSVQCAKYIKSVVISGFAVCLNHIYHSSSLPHIMLLKLILQYYGDRDFVSKLSQRICEEDEELNSVLSHTRKNFEYGEIEEESKRCVSLVHLLASLAEPSSVQTNCVQLTDTLLDCILSLLICGILHEKLINQILVSFIQRNRDWLSLVTLKLLSIGWLEQLKSVLCASEDLVLQAVFDQPLSPDTRPWKLLEAFTSTTANIRTLKEMDVAVLIVNRMCSIVEDMLAVEEELWKERKHLLGLLCQLDPIFVQKASSSIEHLMISLLKWSMRSEACLSQSLNVIAECYSHLLSSLPNISGHLAFAVSSHLTDIDPSHPLTLDRLLKISIVFYCLHNNLPLHKLIGHFCDLLTAAFNNITEDIVPVSSFIQFCEGSLLYSPCAHSSPPTLYDTVPHFLHPILTFVILCCNQQVLVDCMSCLPGSEQLSVLIEKRVLSQRTSELKISLKDDNLIEMWQKVITGCLVVVETTSSSSLKQTSTHLESMVISVCQSIINICFTDEKFVMTLVISLLERLSTTGGMLWALVVRRIIMILRSHDSKGTILRQLFERIVSDVTNGSCLQVMLSACVDGCDWQSNALISTAKRSLVTNSGIVIGCLSLIPSSFDLLSLAGSALSYHASQQSEGHLTLYEDAAVSSKDPTSFSLIYLMIQLVEAQNVPDGCWDMVLCTAVSLIQLLSDTTEGLSMDSCILFCAGLKLCFTLQKELSQYLDSSVLSQRSTEWAEFFLPSIRACLLPMFLSDKTSCWSERSYSHLLSYHLCKAVDVICQPLNCPLEPLFELVATNPLYPVQITAFKLVSRVLVSTNVVIEGLDVPKQSSEKQEISVRILQSLFAKSLEQVNLDVAFFEEQQNTNTVAYMLIWKLLTEAMAVCQAETRVVLTEWLKDQSLMEHLLHGLFKYLLEWRTSLPDVATELSVSLVPNLEHLAFLVYLSVSKQFPQMLRQWYLTLDKQTSVQVMNFTSGKVSPRLWTEEVEKIQSSDTKIGNMEVKVYYGGAQEVAVIYRVDEFSIELAVCVPASYPLQVPSIKEGRRARVDINQWKKWLLQLSVFVANQNGSILDGLMLWKSNLDKHFAGFEDCMICFSVIHSSNFSVPKMTCRTCKKKFHSSCLYKWFNTSAKSSCPLCRNIF